MKNIQLVQELRAFRTNTGGAWHHLRLAQDAADEIEKLQRERNELLEALKEFVDAMQESGVSVKVDGKSVKTDLLAGIVEIIAKVEGAKS